MDDVAPPSGTGTGDSPRPAGARAGDTAGYDTAGYAAVSAALVDAVDDAVEPWVRAAVTVRRPGPVSEGVVADLAARCRARVLEPLRDLVTADVDDQRDTPLRVLGGLVEPVGSWLAEHGAPRPERDPFDRERHPDDAYDLVPRTWADLGPAVAEAGIAWGAAKAHLHLARRRHA